MLFHFHALLFLSNSLIFLSILFFFFNFENSKRIFFRRKGILYQVSYNGKVAIVENVRICCD